MPHKHNADRRHHIPKMSFKVQNWPEYEAGLRRRGSLALWIEGTALECWQTCGPGGQPRDAESAGALAWQHKDPFDRMLVAQARRLTFTLVTADVAIRAYANVAQMWAG
jgi:hypothetical protein